MPAPPHPPYPHPYHSSPSQVRPMSPCSLQQARVFMLQGTLPSLAAAGRVRRRSSIYCCSGDTLPQRGGSHSGATANLHSGATASLHSGATANSLNIHNSRVSLDQHCKGVSIPIALALQLQVS